MHGLVNRAIQGFVEHTYGRDVWLDVCRLGDFGVTDFEPMLSYEFDLTDACLEAICERLDRSRETVLEDIGHYLITNPENQAPRRLLRFSGVTFRDFLYSLDDLPGRARLALDDFQMPMLELSELGASRYHLSVQSRLKGMVYVVLGALRALADDYGALVIMDVRDNPGQIADMIEIALVEASYAEGNAFELGRREVPS